MSYLRGTNDLDIAEIAEEIIKTGFESASLPSLPPSMDLTYQTVGNIVGATRELGDNLFELRYSIITGRETLSVVGNGVIVCAGAYTGGRSAVGYSLTTSPIAKGFYAASAVFSAAAVTNGGMAIMANVCHISRAGVLTEALGIAFMKVGELAHVAALQAEGKPIPQHLQYVNKWSRKPVSNGNLGFIMPGAGSGDFSFISETIAKISFKQIGQLVGVSLTIYGYYKIVVTGYRYSQKLAYKFKRARRSKLLLKQASFIVHSFNYYQISKKNYQLIYS